MTCLGSGILHAASEVDLKNSTDHALSIAISTSQGMARDTWNQKTTTIQAGQKKTYLEFNRDSGIKKNRRYLLTSTIRDQNGCSIELLHYLRGKTIGSYMAQGARGTVVSEPFFTSKEKLFRTFSLCNEQGAASLESATYALSAAYRRVSKVGNDDLEVTVSATPMGELATRQNNMGLELLSYNVFMRPIELFKNDQWERARKIPEMIKDIDLVMLVEAFDDHIRRLMIDTAKPSHPYASQILGTDRVLEQDGGVIALSKYPIIFEQQLLFGSTCRKFFEDCMSDKGALMTAILKDGKIFFVLGTHLEAGGHVNDRKTRAEQLKLIRSFVDSMKIPETMPTFLVGDFNVDRQDTDEYTGMLEILHAYNGAEGFDLPTVDAENIYNEEGTRSQTLDYIFWRNENGWPASFQYNVSKPVVCMPEILCKLKDLSDHYPLHGSFIFSW